MRAQISERSYSTLRWLPVHTHAAELLLVMAQGGQACHSFVRLRLLALLAELVGEAMRAGGVQPANQAAPNGGQRERRRTGHQQHWWGHPHQHTCCLAAFRGAQDAGRGFFTAAHCLQLPGMLHAGYPGLFNKPIEEAAAWAVKELEAHITSEPR